MKGWLITFEGGEGSGKTTQRDLLANYLESKGYEVLKLREPGGVEISEAIRKLLLDPKIRGEIDPLTELLLFSASRSQFVREKLIPALEDGKIVLLDRYYDSTTAYQGYGGGVNLDSIRQIQSIATEGISPHITFLLDVSPEIGTTKLTVQEFGSKDRIERKGISFHEKVRRGYLETAKKEPERIKVINYISGGIERMHKEIVGYVDEILKKTKWQKSLQETWN